MSRRVDSKSVAESSSAAIDPINSSTNSTEPEPSESETSTTQTPDTVQPTIVKRPGGSPSPVATVVGDPKAVAAYQVLKKYCYQCHGVKFEVDGLNMLVRQTVVPKFVTPNNPDKSPLWKRSGIDRDMPPEGSTQPSDAERAVLKDWIAAGAPDFAAEKPRTFITDRRVLEIIDEDLRRNVAPGKESHQRYFTLTNLHNNSFHDRVSKQGKNVDAADLKQARAALSKLLNGLIWERRIVVPVVVDEDQTVL